MLTPDALRAADARIRQLVDSIYVDKSGRAEAIYDGVIDVDQYCKSPCRILWVLKEPWDEPNSSGGGWSLADALREKPVSAHSPPTFHPIIYIAYGLFNKVTAWSDIPDVSAMKNPESILHQIAFINAKKLPGVTRGAYAPSIMEWFSKGKEIVMEQIATYAPEIVFGCSPHFPAILDALQSGWRSEARSVGSAVHVWHQNTLFVHVYHPGQTQISWESYVEDALNAVSQARQQKALANQAPKT